MTRETIPANPPYPPSSAFPPGFFAQPTQPQPQPQEERGRTREPRVKHNTTKTRWMDKRQPPVPPPRTPQMPQPSPDIPMHIPQPSPDIPMHTPPPTQTRPSDETKVKKKSTKRQPERGRSRRPKWTRNDADTRWLKRTTGTTTTIRYTSGTTAIAIQTVRREALCHIQNARSQQSSFRNASS